jgi:NACHT domain
MADPPLLPNDRNPHPQIQQDLKGDRNQAIGQAIDSTIVNFAGDGQVINLTINDRIPTASLPPSNIVVQNLTQQEYRQRQVLLNKVRDAWVKGVLEKSLHARVSIELGLQERPDLVQQPFSDVAEFAAAPGQALPEGTPATTVFDRLGTGRTLLIVGEPGSGKTIALLKLAEDAIDRTEPDLRQQIPVVFNLSSWARKPQSIEQWLIQELLEKYQVSKALGKTWVESEALMLLLDGLDEVKAEQRNACVQALNQFMQTHGTTEIVICCRIGDYQMLQDRLTLRSAICLQPLTVAQIDLYFEQAGDRLSALKAVLPQDAELQELAKSPLMLSVMSLAYQDFTPEQLTVGGKIEDYRKRLFATYIDRMFQRRGTTQQYSREDSQRWLIWLARRMTVASQTVFLIERLQPSWLLTGKQRIRYRVVSGLISGITTGSLIGIMPGLFFGTSNWMLGDLIFGVFNGFILEKSAKLLYLEMIFIIIYGMTGLIGMIYGPIHGLWVSLMGNIKPIETLQWSWRKGRDGFLYGIIFGIIFGIIYGLTTSIGIIDGLPVGITFGLLLGLILGLLISLVIGFQGCEIQKKDKTNYGIYRSVVNALITGVPIFLIVGLSVWLFTGFSVWLFVGTEWTNRLFTGLFYGLLAGLTGGLINGGNASIRHFVLRVMLHRKGYVPWNYARFLDHATDRLFLQKVGGGYIFVHRMLLEHFAEMSIEQGKR